MLVFAYISSFFVFQNRLIKKGLTSVIHIHCITQIDIELQSRRKRKNGFLLSSISSSFSFKLKPKKKSLLDDIFLLNIQKHIRYNEVSSKMFQLHYLFLNVIVLFILQRVKVNHLVLNFSCTILLNVVNLTHDFLQKRLVENRSIKNYSFFRLS